MNDGTRIMIPVQCSRSTSLGDLYTCVGIPMRRRWYTYSIFPLRRRFLIYIR